MSTLRDLLNRARWRDDGLHALEVHVLHRGAPGDRRVVSGARITAVRAGGIEVASDREGEDAIFVPYHRFLAIVGADGTELWPASVPGPVVEATASREEDEGTLVPSLEVLLRAGDPLGIDGSAGEGGGQILRTSLALSMITRRPFVLEKIRAGRKKPGLMRQHLSSVKAAALVCGAEVDGLELGSTRLAFRPGPIRGGEHVIDVGSAGSASLVLQTVAFPLLLADGPSRITVRGGTHALWAPPYPFLERAWLPLVRRAGAEIALSLVQHGFYPAGGGEVVMTVAPSKLAPLHLGASSGVLAKLSLRAVVSALPEGIARRELTAAAEALGDVPHELASETVRSAGPGNAMWLVARDEGTGLCNVFSGIGDVGVRAEDIGRDVAKAFLAWRGSGAAIEGYLADQVLLPIALAGAGSFTTSELSLHARTNMAVIEAFTGFALRARAHEGYVSVR